DAGPDHRDVELAHSTTLGRSLCRNGFSTARSAMTSGHSPGEPYAAASPAKPPPFSSRPTPSPAHAGQARRPPGSPLADGARRRRTVTERARLQVFRRRIRPAANGADGADRRAADRSRESGVGATASKPFLHPQAGIAGGGLIMREQGFGGGRRVERQELALD